MKLYRIENDLQYISYVVATNLEEAIKKYRNEFASEIISINIISKDVIIGE